MSSSRQEADFSPGSDESDIDDELSLYLTAGESLTPAVKLTEEIEVKQESVKQLEKQQKQIQCADIFSGRSDHENIAADGKNNVLGKKLVTNQQFDKLPKSEGIKKYSEDIKTCEYENKSITNELNFSGDLAGIKKVLSRKNAGADTVFSNDLDKFQQESLPIQQNNCIARENKKHEIENEKLVNECETQVAEKQGSCNIDLVKGINKKAENDESENFDETDDELLYYLTSGETSQLNKNTDVNAISVAGDMKQNVCIEKENTTVAKQKEQDCGTAQKENIVIQQNCCISEENKDPEIEEKLVNKFETKVMKKQDSSCIISVKSVNKEDKNNKSENFSETDDELLYYLTAGETSQRSKDSVSDISSAADVLSQKEKTSEPKKDTFQDLLETNNKALQCQNNKGPVINELKTPLQLAVQSDKIISNEFDKECENDQDIVDSLCGSGFRKCHSGLEENTDMNGKVKRLDESLKDGDNSCYSFSPEATYHSNDVEIDTTHSQESCFLNEQNQLTETAEVKTVGTCENSENTKENGSSELQCTDESVVELQSKDPEINTNKHIEQPHFQSHNDMEDKMKGYNEDITISSSKTHTLPSEKKTNKRKHRRKKKKNNNNWNKSPISSLPKKRNYDPETEKNEMSQDSSCKEDTGNDIKIMDTNNYDDTDSIDDPLESYLIGNIEETRITQSGEPNDFASSYQNITNEKVDSELTNGFQKMTSTNIEAMLLKNNSNGEPVFNNLKDHDLNPESSDRKQMHIKQQTAFAVSHDKNVLELHQQNKIEESESVHGLHIIENRENDSYANAGVKDSLISTPSSTFGDKTEISLESGPCTYSDKDEADDGIDDPLASYLDSDAISQKEVAPASERAISLSSDNLKTNENRKNTSCDQLPDAGPVITGLNVSTQIESVKEGGMMKIQESVEGDRNIDIHKSVVLNKNFYNGDSENQVSLNLPNHKENWFKDTHLLSAKTLDNNIKSKSPSEDYSSETEHQIYEQYPELNKQLKRGKICNYSPIKQRDIESLKKMFDYSSLGFSEQITIKSPSEIVSEPHSDMCENKSERHSMVEITIISPEETGSDVSINQTTSGSNACTNDTLHESIKDINSDKNSQAFKDVKQLMVGEGSEQLSVKCNPNNIEGTATTDNFLNHSSHLSKVDNEPSSSEDRNDRGVDSHGPGKSGEETNINEIVSGVNVAKLNGTADKFRHSESLHTKSSELPQVPGRFIRRNNRLYKLKVVNGKQVEEEFMSSKSKKVLDEKPRFVPFKMNSNSGLGTATKSMNRDSDKYVMHVVNQKSSKVPVFNKLNQITGVCANNVVGKVRSTSSCTKTETYSQTTNQSNFLKDTIQTKDCHQSGLWESQKSALDNVESVLVNKSDHVSSEHMIYKKGEHSSATQSQEKNRKGTATIRVFRVEQSPTKTGIVKRKFIILQDDGKYHEIESTESFENSHSSQPFDKDTEVLIPETEISKHTERFITDVKRNSDTKSKVVMPLKADVATQSRASFITCKCMCKSVAISSAEQEKQMLKMKRHRQRIRNLKAHVQMKNNLKANKMKAASFSKSEHPCVNDKQSTETHRKEHDQPQSINVKKDNTISANNSLDLKVTDAYSNSFSEKYCSDQETSIKQVKSDFLKDTTDSKGKRETDKPAETNTNTSISQTYCSSQQVLEKQHKRVLEKDTVCLKRKTEDNIPAEFKKSSLPKRATLEAKFSVQGERELKNLMIDMKKDSRNIDIDSILNNEMQSEKDFVETRTMRLRMRVPKETSQNCSNEDSNKEVKKEKGYVTVTKDSNDAKHPKIKSTSEAVSSINKVKRLVNDLKHGFSNRDDVSELKVEFEPLKPKLKEKQDKLLNSTKTLTKAPEMEGAKRKESVKISNEYRKQLANRRSHIKLETHRTCSPSSSKFQKSSQICGHSAQDKILENEPELGSNRETPKSVVSNCNKVNQKFCPNIATAMEECLQRIRMKQRMELDITENTSNAIKMESKNGIDNMCGHAGSSKVKEVGRGSHSYTEKLVDDERQLCQLCGCFVTPDSEMTDCMHENVPTEIGHSGSEVEQDSGDRNTIKYNSNGKNTKLSMPDDKTVDHLMSKKRTNIRRKVRFKEPSNASRKESTLKRNVRDWTEDKGNGTKKSKLSSRVPSCISTTGSENRAQTGVTKNTGIQQCKGKTELKPGRKTKGRKSGKSNGHCSKEIEVGGRGIDIQLENKMDIINDMQVDGKETDDCELLSWDDVKHETGLQKRYVTEDLDKSHKKEDIKKKYSKIQGKRKNSRKKKVQKQVLVPRRRGRKKKVLPLGFNYRSKGKMGIEGWRNMLYDKAFHFHDIIQKQRKPDVNHVKRLLGRVLSKTKDTDSEKLKKHKAKIKVGSANIQDSRNSATHQDQFCQFQSFHFSPTKGEIGSTPEYPISVENPFLSFFKHGVTERVQTGTLRDEPLSVERNDSGSQVGRVLHVFREQNEKPLERLGTHRFPASHLRNLSVGQLPQRTKLQTGSQASENDSFRQSFILK